MDKELKKMRVIRICCRFIDAFIEPKPRKARIQGKSTVETWAKSFIRR